MHNHYAKCEAFHFAPRLFFSVFVFDSIHDSVTMHGVSHHLASPMAASAFVPVPIGGFSTESGLFLLYIKNRLERGFAPADGMVI